MTVEVDMQIKAVPHFDVLATNQKIKILLHRTLFNVQESHLRKISLKAFCSTKTRATTKNKESLEVTYGGTLNFPWEVVLLRKF
jgi:hypothetical protein